MSVVWRRLLLVPLLVAVLVLGGQRPTAFACAMGDAACQDHCAIMAGSCATACVARLAPAPLALPPPATMALQLTFSFDRPVLAGLTLAPDPSPPRLSA